MIVSNRSNRTRTPTTSSEDLFLCFTSRLSSSSMKISSKSLSLNAVHSRDQSLSLSNSLSRRLRTNGIMKLGGKNRGSGFENPEPSSPKVTCIGQVRIKSKKALSNQSFQTKPSNQNQKDELGERNHSNQRWVHFPFSICEGLKSFGAEFSSLFQCRSPEKEDKSAALGGGEGGRSSCGAVFGRWLVAVQDEEREDERTEEPKQSNLRKHVFDDIDIEIEDEKCEGRLSICIPPKNALLLMRYRSDPVKMSNLENKLWESNVGEFDEEEEQEEQVKLDETEVCEMWVSEEYQEDEVKMVMEVQEVEEQEERENPDDKVEIFEELHQENQEESVEEVTQSVVQRESEEDEVTLNQEEEEEVMTQERSEPEEDGFLERESELKKLERESSVLPDCLLLMMREKFKREKVKLSMEVSEETWVSIADFIRWLPERAVKAINGSDGFKNRVNAVSNPTLNTHPAHHQPIQQPPRSSCSFPAPAPAAVAVVEQKPVNAVAYEPFALTRCKSAPMRTAAKLAPEKCFWKDSKLEPFGIGAAGIGF